MRTLFIAHFLLITICSCEPQAAEPDVARLGLLRDEIGQCDSDTADAADDTLAVAIEWIRMRDSVSLGPIKRGADFFLGYLNGRIRLAPPDWWRYEIRNATVNGKEPVGFDCDRLHSRWISNEQGWHFTGVDEIEVQANALWLGSVTQKRRLKLLRSIFRDHEPAADPESEPPDGEWHIESDDGISVAIHGDVCALALNSRLAPDRLYCIDTTSLAVRWSQELIFSAMPPDTGNSTGPPPGSFTHIIADDDRFSVWTVNVHCAMVEVFDQTDGKRIMTFASHLLDGIHLPTK